MTEEGAPVTTFRAAVEARDLDTIGTMLAEDVVFHSPVVFQPYQGKAITLAILRTVIQVFEDFRYLREIRDPGGDEVLVFQATVDGLEITGCDLLRYDAEGKITDFMVLVRPLRAAQALQREMAARFAQIEADATAAESRR